MSAQIIIDALRRGNKVLVCGNGGSAAQAQHFATELVVRYKKNRRSLPCIALTADSSILTACGNDLGYDQVFSRQVEAYGAPGDVLLALSTSGKSANVLKAIEAAQSKGLHVIKLFGSKISGETSVIQEDHLCEIHDWAEEIENAFADS